ncbi:hypothetical protein K438DRAFT_1964550 [Mycena galopus ATCC 62051]|nr:hypothetical protein K438DRAFT_1964550 [Mycena galopus ATCC 62051]
MVLKASNEYQTLRRTALGDHNSQFTASLDSVPDGHLVISESGFYLRLNSSQQLEFSTGVKGSASGARTVAVETSLKTASSNAHPAAPFHSACVGGISQIVVRLHAMLFDNNYDTLVFDWNPIYWGIRPLRANGLTWAHRRLVKNSSTRCAMRSFFKSLLEVAIVKMLDKEVWGCWYLTSQSGQRADPDLKELRKPWADPIVTEIIMAWHLLLMVSLHAMLFDDDKSDASDALVFAGIQSTGAWDAKYFRAIAPRSRTPF